MIIAVLHDWLETYAGGERVLEQILKVFPNADLFAMVDFYEGDRGWLKGKRAKTSFLQWLPFAKRHFRKFLPLFPFAVWSLNLRKYDVVVSTSHCMIKNVRIRRGQPHICYCHSPIRYAWDLQDEYLAQTGYGSGVLGFLVRWTMAWLRWVDVRGSRTVSLFIANSSFIKERIERCYSTPAVVLSPPVSAETTNAAAGNRSYYVTLSRQVPYKKIDVIVKAFAAMPERELVVIGDGPERERIAAAAQGCRNIRLMGYMATEEALKLVAGAKAFVFAALEDFGIAPVEAQALGLPVIAYGKGGVLDSIVPLGQNGSTGVFFHEQTPEAIEGAVDCFERDGAKITSENCRRQAARFSPEAFRTRFEQLVRNHLVDNWPATEQRRMEA